MCESRVVSNGEEIVKEAAKVTIDGKNLLIHDILGKTTELKNYTIKDINFVRHTIEVVKNED